MAPCRSTDSLPSRLITTPDWLPALFVQVSRTDVALTARAVGFDGAAGTAVLLADRRVRRHGGMGWIAGCREGGNEITPARARPMSTGLYMFLSLA